MAIIDYLIMGATKNEDIEQLFNFSKTLKNTLELIDRFYDKIYIKLKSAQKEKKQVSLEQFQIFLVVQILLFQLIIQSSKRMMILTI